MEFRSVGKRDRDCKFGDMTLTSTDAWVRAKAAAASKGKEVRMLKWIMWTGSLSFLFERDTVLKMGPCYIYTFEASKSGHLVVAHSWSGFGIGWTTMNPSIAGIRDFQKYLTTSYPGLHMHNYRSQNYWILSLQPAHLEMKSELYGRRPHRNHVALSAVIGIIGQVVGISKLKLPWIEFKM